MRFHTISFMFVGLLGLGLLPGAAPTAEAASGVTLHRPVVDGDRVSFTGEASARARVRLQQRVAGAWKGIAVVRSDRSGDFSITQSHPTTSSRYRVVSDGVRSTVRKVAAPTEEPTPPPPTDECGVRPVKADGSHWSCTLAEDFDGTALDTSIWKAMRQPGPAGGACNVNDPRTVEVSGGMLRLTVQPVTSTLTCPPLPDGTTNAYASGSVSTFLKWSQQYGRFEARMKVDDADHAGLQEAFWLWPDVRYSDGTIWPAAGEIDIAETYSQYPDLAIPFLHYTANDNGGPRDGLNTAWDCPTTRGEFHTYALEWTAERLEIFVDGASCLVNTSGDPAFQKRYIMAFTQLLGRAKNAYTGAAASPRLPATMEVDYVRVWE